jgi:hypothetical protein
MAVMSYQMAMSGDFENTRPAPWAAASAHEAPVIGWNDSSWDLQRGLDVVEDLPLDAWPLEQPLASRHNAA